MDKHNADTISTLRKELVGNDVRIRTLDFLITKKRSVFVCQ